MNNKALNKTGTIFHTDAGDVGVTKTEEPEERVRLVDAGRVYQLEGCPVHGALGEVHTLLQLAVSPRDVVWVKRWVKPGL